MCQVICIWFSHLIPRHSAERYVLKQANNSAYEEAVKLLQKIRELMGGLDRVTEFEDYVEALRVEYKRKRNFIKLLDTIKSL